MIKLEVTKEFTLGKFNEIKNLVRFNPNLNEKGRLYLGDTFECDEDLTRYLTGENDKKVIVAKVIEVIPDEVITNVTNDNNVPKTKGIDVVTKYESVKPKTAKKKSSKK